MHILSIGKGSSESTNTFDICFWYSFVNTGSSSAHIHCLLLHESRVNVQLNSLPCTLRCATLEYHSTFYRNYLKFHRKMELKILLPSLIQKEGTYVKIGRVLRTYTDSQYRQLSTINFLCNSWLRLFITLIPFLVNNSLGTHLSFLFVAFIVCPYIILILISTFTIYFAFTVYVYYSHFYTNVCM